MGEVSELMREGGGELSSASDIAIWDSFSGWLMITPMGLIGLLDQ